MYLKLATLADLQSYSQLTRSFYEESPFYPSVSYNPTLVEDLLHVAVESNYEKVLVLLLVDNSTPVGLLIGYATTTPFSHDLIASELAWYVSPNYRGQRKALDLVYAYEEWAKRIGCKHISMSLLTTLTDATKLYERLGYKKTEISFMKEL